MYFLKIKFRGIGKKSPVIENVPLVYKSNYHEEAKNRKKRQEGKALSIGVKKNSDLDL